MIVLFAIVLLLLYLITQNTKEGYATDDVSVVIPSYNRFKLLKKTIESVHKQSYPHITEIIVVDDCSTDPEYQSGELEKMKKVRLIRLPINQRELYKTTCAQGKTRDHGLKVAKGKWIAFLDDDDLWTPDKLQKQFEALQKHPKCEMSSTNGRDIDLDNNKKQDLMHKNLPEIVKGEDIREQNLIINSSVLIKKSLCDRVGDFNLGVNEDWDYWKRAMEHTQCCVVDLPLTLIRYDSRHLKNYQ